MYRTILLGALLAMLAAPAFAQDKKQLKVGDPVADFQTGDWINQSTFKSFSEFKGDVVIIKAWGIN